MTAKKSAQKNREELKEFQGGGERFFRMDIIYTPANIYKSKKFTNHLSEHKVSLQ